MQNICLIVFIIFSQLLLAQSDDLYGEKEGSKSDSKSDLYKQKLLLSDDERIYFQDIVSIDSTSQKVLFLNTYEWFVNNFNSANEVIQLKDEESGKIIGKGLSKSLFRARIGGLLNGDLYYTIKVSVKDGKYRFMFTDIDFKLDPIGDVIFQKTNIETVILDEYLYKDNGKVRPTNKQYKELVINQFTTLSANFKKHMISKSKSKEEDW